jgi:recombination protein RecT
MKPTAPTAVAVSPVTKLANLMQQYKGQIAAALPKHVTADRLMRICLTEFRKNPKLQQCDHLSFLGAVVTAASLGLEPGSALGQCYLIPYKNECEFQISYRGMVDLARRSGNIVSISARCVYEGDEFSVALGTEETIHHVPRFATTNLVSVYAVAKLVGGGTQFEVMSVGEVEYIRNKFSKQPGGKAWTDSYDEMAKKTVVRRLFKMLPASVELSAALTAEDTKSHEILDADYSVPAQQADPQKYAQVVAGDRTAKDALDQAAWVGEFKKYYALKNTAPDFCGPDPIAWASTASVPDLVVAVDAMFAAN